ncbi:hypothetical protein CXF68_19760 [Tenacibaculum sp. Bg11-29]|uniref:gliding motility-associated C-terminal domain-containing protein n=1 Tax=Tenacibaculum sp. Bg11-29 TaxID=2058306 RepID=UPI000C321E10|nr:gliding motility-associated C-terminal domain-containing protein [Tenacibaculum sp. Bg11-29]PKH52794.1 hypothetical protein CXF68_19760 [Tenacibaculum sp. Bg11-29]
MQKKILFSLLLFSLSLFNIFSQCAGADNTVTICNKESDTNYQTYNLFNQLQGTPLAGGHWFANSPINQNAINNNTGIVNLWAINRFGEHTFTYTNPNCNESSEITIFLGGYPGEDNINGGANACSNDTTVNLFTFLDNNLTNLSADINGEWKEVPGTPTGFLTDNIFNAELAGAGTYALNYIVSNVNSCASKTATVILEVHRSPNAGIAMNLEICDTDNLSLYDNVNLFDYVMGQDSNGVWTDVNNTGQIQNALDATINIEEIYQLFGSGKYDFTYTVYPLGVCEEQSVTVSVILPKIAAAFSVINQCKDDSLLIEILHEATLDSSMTYDLVYEIVNTTTNNIVYTNTLNDISLTDDDGNINLEKITLPNDTLTPGSYIIRTATINNINGIICNSFMVVEKSFIIYEGKAKIEDTCYDEDDLNLTIYDFYNDDGSLFTGTKTVDYTIKGSTNDLIVNTYSLTFLNGEAIIPINFSSFPTNENDFNFTISSTSQSGLNCINYDFSINRVPEDIELGLTIDNVCNASDIKAIINAPAMADGGYTINYEVSEVNTANILTENTIFFAASGGSANYNIDISNLETGTYNVVIKSTQNDTTPCRTVFDFEIRESFSINGIPDAPVLNANQSFCLSDYHPNSPTLANIAITSGENLTWYADNTSTTPLNYSTTLVNGEDYYVSSKDISNSCESSDRTAVTVTILTPQIVTSTNTTPLFCGIEKATIANLDAEVNSGELLWYDSPTNGNLLTTDTILVNGVTYYATESITGCESISRLPFTITVIAPPIPVVEGITLLCGLEKLTLLDFEMSLTNTANYNFIWYDALLGGLELDSSDLLEENTVYYVANIHPGSGCESERTPISVSLNNCNPEDYDFFIPDGFSPNGDGVNDFYYIPNIDYFYPDYQLEIFNRYGQSLFKGDVNTPKWNGKSTSSKNNTTSGVYFYILKYNKDNIKPKQGRIYLSK